MFLRSLPISVGIGAAIGGPNKEFLEAICENPLHVEALMANIESEKAKQNG